MLPTKGYFQTIECPFYEHNCNRPYCHFLHRKKSSEIPEEISSEIPKDIEVPTYKPTPKSELANIKSHIPISYVPDLAYTTNRTSRPLPKFTFDKPTYKPTPLSILSSANKPENSGNNEGDDDLTSSDDLKAIREIKQNIANVEYNPEVSLIKDDIDFEELSAEFDLIDDLIDDKKPKGQNSENKDKDVTIEVKNKTEDAKFSSKSDHNHSKTRSSSSKSKSKHHKSETKDRHRDRDKEKEHRKSKHKSKEKEKEKHLSEHKSSKHRSSRDKDKSRDKKKTSSKSKKIENPTKQKKENKQISSESEQEINFASEVVNSDNLSDLDLDDMELEDEDTLLECYKIFNEYKPPDPAEVIKTPAEEKILAEEPSTPEIPSSRKRVAHSSSTGMECVTRPPPVKQKTYQSPGQVMLNRFKLAKQVQGDDEQRNIINEMRRESVKRPPPSLLEAAQSMKIKKMVRQQPAPSGNLIDSILNGAKIKPKKIAPVMNVTSIQRAKAKVDELAKNKAAEALNKTPAQTSKGNKRVAHMPDFSLSDIPDVINADKSKLPINVRTRFLTLLADECVKLYLIKEDAYTRALNEEFSCYEKCKVLPTYKNSAMLAVNRVRKELQERDKLNLGPIGVGESPTKGKSGDFKGQKFYENIKQYILTDEELDIHGYPKESSVHGQAIITNRRNSTSIKINLPENQRKCARCSKIYLVDEDGFVLYPEQCVYHPLKKRTLRGEQMYLCCKSGDGTGCATSNTHVCDLPEEAELEGFQTTMPPERDDDPRSFAVYALDCEMCYTIKGLELTRVTIVDSDCKTVYESLVKPWNPIIDYNTNFSGITKDQMDRTSTSILQVQANILHLCNSKTILIGHSLESDMKALKIIHGTVIDTSVLFPHKMGLPHKRALRVLASEFLKKIIQNSVSGHDSAEDAIACMDLVKWKIKEELKVRGK